MNVNSHRHYISNRYKIFRPRYSNQSNDPFGDVGRSLPPRIGGHLRIRPDRRWTRLGGQNSFSRYRCIPVSADGPRHLCVESPTAEQTRERPANRVRKSWWCSDRMKHLFHSIDYTNLLFPSSETTLEKSFVWGIDFWAFFIHKL